MSKQNRHWRWPGGHRHNISPDQKLSAVRLGTRRREQPRAASVMSVVSRVSCVTCVRCHVCQVSRVTCVAGRRPPTISAATPSSWRNDPLLCAAASRPATPQAAPPWVQTRWPAAGGSAVFCRSPASPGMSQLVGTIAVEMWRNLWKGVLLTKVLQYSIV